MQWIPRAVFAIGGAAPYVSILFTTRPEIFQYQSSTYNKFWQNGSTVNFFYTSDNISPVNYVAPYKVMERFGANQGFSDPVVSFRFNSYQEDGVTAWVGRTIFYIGGPSSWWTGSGILSDPAGPGDVPAISDTEFFTGGATGYVNFPNAGQMLFSNRPGDADRTLFTVPAANPANSVYYRPPWYIEVLNGDEFAFLHHATVGESALTSIAVYINGYKVHVFDKVTTGGGEVLGGVFGIFKYVKQKIRFELI